jgi:hypothetical protein
VHQLAVEPRGEQLGMFTKLKAEDLEEDTVALERVATVAEGQVSAEMTKPPLPRADAKPLLQRDLPRPYRSMVVLVSSPLRLNICPPCS